MIFAVTSEAWTTLVIAVAGLVTALAAAVPGIVALLNSRRNAAALVKSDAGLDARVSLHDEVLSVNTKPAGEEASAMAGEPGSTPVVPASVAAVLEKKMDTIPAKTAAMVRSDAERDRNTPAT